MPETETKVKKYRKRRESLITPISQETAQSSKRLSPIQHANKNFLEHYQKALMHMDNGNVDKAMKILDSKEIEKATQGQSGLLLAKALMQNQEIQRARNILHRIASLYKGTKTHALLLMAHIYWNEKQYQKAIDVLMEEMPLIQNHTDYYSFLAQAYLKVEQPELASSIYNKLLEINALNARWWIGLGMAYQDLKRYDLAKDAFGKSC